jgi:polyisoprenoid-binding protein YceI
LGRNRLGSLTSAVSTMNWKRLTLIGILLELACVSSPVLRAQPASWRIDPLHSSAQFSVRHMMISTVRGQFGGVKGAITYDPKNPAASSVIATIDCATVNTGEPKRDSDLKTAEFFDVKRYPVMTYKSKKVTVLSPGKLRVTGDLTINAITRQVILDLDGPTPPIRDTNGREKIGVSGTTKVSRKEFGILYNPIMESGGVAVSDEVTINLEIELIKN